MYVQLMVRESTGRMFNFLTQIPVMLVLKKGTFSKLLMAVLTGRWLVILQITKPP